MENVVKKRKAKDSPDKEHVDRQLRKETKAKKVNYSEELSEESEDERSRTPSGTIITNKASDIRGFFSPGGVIKNKGSGEKAPLTPDTLQVKKSIVSGSVKPVKRKITIKRSRDHASMGSNENTVAASALNALKVKHAEQEKEQQSSAIESDRSTADNWTEAEEGAEEDAITNSNQSADDEGDQSEAEMKVQQLIAHDSKKKEDEMLLQIAQVMQRNNSTRQQRRLKSKGSPRSNKSSSTSEKDLEEDMRLKDSIDSAIESFKDNMMASSNQAEDAEPKSISLVAVMEMFRELKQQFAVGREEDRKNTDKKFKEMKKRCVEQTSREVSEILEQEQKEIDKVKAEVAFWKMKSDTMTDVCQRLCTEVEDLTTRVENLEVNNSKKMISISGLDMEKMRKFEGVLFLEKFFQDNLFLEVHVEDFFNIGTSLIVVFQSQQHKRDTMHFKYLLKDVRNSRNQKIFINDYMPPTTNEKRRREQDVIHVSTPQNPQEPLEVFYTKAGLSVQGDIYAKKVFPPTAKELINLQPEEIEKLLQIQLTRSPDMMKERSVFTAYALRANTHEEINNVYKKLKLVQPEARHIVCAYAINSEIPYYAKDYHDDGEPGAGRKLAEILEGNSLTDGYAVFVVRKYGGIRLGADRFDYYSNAARIALERLCGVRMKTKQEIRLMAGAEKLRQMQTNFQQQQQNIHTPGPPSAPSNPRGRYQRGGGNYRGGRGSGRGGPPQPQRQYRYPVFNKRGRPGNVRGVNNRQGMLNSLRGGGVQVGTRIQQQITQLKNAWSIDQQSNEQSMEYQFSNPEQVNLHSEQEFPRIGQNEVG